MLAKFALRWVHRRYHENRSSNGTTQTHIQVSCRPFASLHNRLLSLACVPVSISVQGRSSSSICGLGVSFHVSRLQVSTQNYSVLLQRDLGKLRELVFVAERALLTELGFFFPDFPLHGEVYRLCIDLSFPEDVMQAAWNIANDRCASYAEP